ncbi:Acetyltransferase (GNAT) family protein [Salinimicrobium catena]|uniref:Acetyltransferase (GNAT) family protein n=1 Tax=Salinimicrobium catena TaxID=390640 RepID=A0A1H5P997_9FLAO|nr:GNAT family N-acetyltransferase [Salinimicrobium catena]SDL73789.1 Acetyltransferase (GNAT) family protein [Salinimicrobium catena]SEF10475.1 Acetyltransferase (GNAT) family protein [Salinimicrobium catena]
MIKIKRSNSTDVDFQFLVSELDKDLAVRNGEANEFFAQYNKIDLIKNVIVAFIDDKPVGCGAMKEYDMETMEIKRMFVPIEMRGKGIAVEILDNLEKWAKEMNYSKCVLETGDKMLEAIRLYKKSNYKVIPNYGQYVNIETSVCFRKEI